MFHVQKLNKENSGHEFSSSPQREEGIEKHKVCASVMDLFTENTIREIYPRCAHMTHERETEHHRKLPQLTSFTSLLIEMVLG